VDKPLTNAERIELDLLVDRVIEQMLDQADVRRLNELLQTSLEAVRRYNQSIDTHRALCEIFPTGMLEETLLREAESQVPGTLLLAGSSSASRQVASSRLTLLAVALTVMGLVSGISYTIGRRDSQPPTNPLADNSQGTGVLSATSADRSGHSDNPPDTAAVPAEATLTGHGILRQTLDIVWPDGQPPRPAGSLLQPGELRFESGVAVLDFFSGATLVVAGPARLEVVSDWVVTVHQGRLEATVPPAAQGFVVKAAGAEIIDLGTRFALDISPDRAQVAVLDGEIMLRTKQAADDRLVTGDKKTLRAGPVQPGFINAIPRLEDIDSRGASRIRSLFERAGRFIHELAADPRLIACFSTLAEIDDRRVRNLATTGYASDAQLIGPVEIVPGRFPGRSSGLHFSRPGSRVRVKIDGSFTAYTFACWAKINSLRHTYNALFLADGYENGEPHWQIRNDGRLMFSVMVDDRRAAGTKRSPTGSPSETRRFHRVYFTEPVWESSMIGRWVHIAAVYDPASRLVTQYIDGLEVSHEVITDAYFIDDLRIGAAEIGNWGQPFRKTPDFAVRNLDGVIDEMIIFDAALSAAEIFSLYEQGTPQ